MSKHEQKTDVSYLLGLIYSYLGRRQYFQVIRECNPDKLRNMAKAAIAKRERIWKEDEAEAARIAREFRDMVQADPKLAEAWREVNKTEAPDWSLSDIRKILDQ